MTESQPARRARGLEPLSVIIPPVVVDLEFYRDVVHLRPPGPGELAALNAGWAATATGHFLAVIEGGQP